jgi:hypothetical protein
MKIVTIIQENECEDYKIKLYHWLKAITYMNKHNFHMIKSLKHAKIPSEMHNN